MPRRRSSRRFTSQTDLVEDEVMQDPDLPDQPVAQHNLADPDADALAMLEDDEAADEYERAIENGEVDEAADEADSDAQIEDEVDNDAADGGDDDDDDADDGEDQNIGDAEAAEDDDEEAEGNEEAETKAERVSRSAPSPGPRRRGRPRKQRKIGNDEFEAEDAVKTTTLPRRRRGRQAAGAQITDKLSAAVVPEDAAAEPFTVNEDEDEIVLDKLDPNGETKVDEDGRLQGGREYRVRAFTVIGRGDRLFMLSTEPARCVGYRDSYLFFIRHRLMYRVVLSDDEKEDLYSRDLIPPAYRARQLMAVTARSVFREFGARVVIGGRRIQDDYWVEEYRRLGYPEGELADPTDVLPHAGQPYNRNQFLAWQGGKDGAAKDTVIMTAERSTRSRRTGLINDSNWIYEHANAASNYNRELTIRRAAMNDGILEPHTNVHFKPANTQPSTFEWSEVAGAEDAKGDAQTRVSGGKVIVDAAMCLRSGAGSSVDMSAVDHNLLTLLSPSVRSAVMTRRALEISERNHFDTKLARGELLF